MSEKNKHLIDAGDVAAWLSLPRRKVIAMARCGTMPCYALPCGEFVFAEHEIRDWLLARKRGADYGQSALMNGKIQSEENEVAHVE
jgi:hypothetical protein